MFVVIVGFFFSIFDFYSSVSVDDVCYFLSLGMDLLNFIRMLDVFVDGYEVCFWCVLEISVEFFDVGE